MFVRWGNVYEYRKVYFLNLAVIFPLDFESQSTPAQGTGAKEGQPSQARRARRGNIKGSFLFQIG